MIMGKYLRNILLLLSVVFLFACSKKVEIKEPVSEIIIKTTFSDFGGVLIGNEKNTVISVTNKTKADIQFSTEMQSPFVLTSLSQACSNKIIKIDQSCSISVKFIPIVQGEFEMTLPIGTSSVTLKGVGLQNGYLVLSDYVWNMGTISSGVNLSKVFEITNYGDLSVPTPTFNLPSFMRIGLNRCGMFIASKDKCQITLESQITEAGNHNGQIDFNSVGGGFGSINYLAVVNSSGASGLISFESTPLRMDSTGEEFIFKTKPIKDVFGNIIPIGTKIYLTLNDNLISLDGNVFESNILGVIQFRVRTRTIKGEGVVSLNSDQASGYVNFPITAGDAFGTIPIKTFTTHIPANGQTQTVISTDVIHDQYSNIIENGTEVIFEVIGTAAVGSGANPKIRKTVAIDGTAFARVTSGTVASVVTVKIYSGAIKNELGEIVGYKANGQVNVTLVPGPAFGTFSISSNVNAIYSNNNPPEGSLIPTQTNVNIGPIKDEFGNVVLQNTPVNINIVNGLNVSGNVPETQSIIYTDSLGKANFTLTGANQRGNISVSASSSGASATLDVWGYEKSRVKFDINKDAVDFSMLHHPARKAPSKDTNWNAIKDATSMSSLDSEAYGFVKYSDRATTKFGMNSEFPYFNWDCTFTAGSYLIFNFCMQSNGQYSPMYKYSSSFNFLLDSPQVNELVEMVDNGEFTAQKGLSFWNQMEGNPSFSTGIKYSPNNSGSMWIDNAIFVDPSDTSKRKKFAASSPITVDPLKRYVVLFTIKEMIGTTENSHLSFGYIKETSDYGTPGYTLKAPTILQNDFTITSVGLQQRVIFNPPEGTTSLRLYFSTKGSGNGSDLKIDDISMKELTTQNIHDLTSMDGVSVAYMPKWDQAIMFGGTAAIKQNASQYSTINSAQTTVLSRVLDPSIGIIITKYPENTQTNIGTKPTKRGYMSIASSDDFLYTYGGLALGGQGSAKDDFNIWDGANLKWIKETIGIDTSISDPNELELGKPGKRYQNGLLHIPELNNVYVIGGLKQDKDIESVWYSTDDLWKVNLSESNKKWNLICGVCDFAPTGIYSNIAKAWGKLETSPNDTNFNNYVYAARNLKTVNSIWHSATQKAYFYIPETPYFKKFNPFSETFEKMEIGGLYDFRGTYKLEYNPTIGRTYGYTRGEPGSKDSKIFFWDMNRDEKQYVKVNFNLEENAKTYIKELKINLYAYGESVTFRTEGSISEAGVELYLFNNATMKWQLVGQNSAKTSVSAQSALSFFVDDSTVSDYVSVDGKVSALITPRGRPGFSGGDPKMGDGLKLVKLKDVSNAMEEIRDIYTGGQTSCAILTDDTVKCWGRNENGQLGQGTAAVSIGESANEMATINPVRIFNKNDPEYANVVVEQLTIGGSHVCALLSNKQVKCWGDNAQGKLGAGINPIDSNTSIGDGANEMYTALPRVSLFATSKPYEILKIEAGQDHTCALIKVSTFGTRNRVKCWGQNHFGQLGTGDTQSRGATPAQMGDGLPFISGVIQFYDQGLGITREGTIKDLVVGNNHSCVVVETINGKDALQCWGRNHLGQLSIPGGSIVDKNIATSTSIQTIEIYKIKAGGNHSCMNYYDGTFDKFLCWGANSYGQLGRGGGGLVSNDLVENGSFSNGLTGWSTMGSIIPTVVSGEAKIYGGGNGLRQSFSNLKIDKTYEFEMSVRQSSPPPVTHVINSSLQWQVLSGYGYSAGLAIDVGNTGSTSVSRVRTVLLTNNIQPQRNYTYRFNVTNAQGTPYFKIIDDNYNIIYSSDKLAAGSHTISFDLKPHQDSLYIDWYIDKYQKATISTMELYKNPPVTLPIDIILYKNVGFGWEIFSADTITDSGTYRKEFISQSGSIRAEIISDPNVSIAEQIFVDNVTLKIKNELLVELPLDLSFEFLDFTNISPMIANTAMLDEIYVPKNFYPNFKAIYQKMLNFDSVQQNRIELENYPILNMNTQDFVFEMEIDPKNLSTRRPLLSKIALSPKYGKITTTGGWIFFIDQNKRLSFHVDGLGIVAESLPIEPGFQKVRVQKTTEGSVSKIKFFRNRGIGWGEITMNGNLSNGNPAPNISGIDLSKGSDAPLVIGSTFDDSVLEGEQRAFGHYEGLIGYVYMKVGSDTINFIEGLLKDNNVLADFTDIGGAEMPEDFSLGDNHTCVITASSEIKCFGDNVGGQVGYGQDINEYGISLEHMGYNLPAVDLGTDMIPVSISAGGEFNCATFADGTAKCWGRNAFGQLGVDTKESHGRGKDNVMGTNELKIDYIDLEGIF